MSHSANVNRFLTGWLLFSFLLASNVYASDNPFAWDLSYANVFKKNDVQEKDTMFKYFNDAYYKKGRLQDMHLPDGLFADIDMSKIKNAILIDYQVYWYMGHRSATLYLDNGKTVVARSYNSKSNRVDYFETKPAYFAKFSEAIFNHTQSTPAGAYKFKVAKGYSFAGYIGVISTYSLNGKNQQLITVEDLLNKKMEPGELGKVINAAQRRLKPVYMQN